MVMEAGDTLQVKDGVDQETIDAVKEVSTYKYGWDTDIEMEYAPKGVNEDIVKLISEKNLEPEWMTNWRLEALERWKKMTEPKWAMVDYPEIDFELIRVHFKEWEHNKEEDIMTYRNRSFSSPVTGTVAPLHHTAWGEAMDDSMKTFMESK